jgi:rhodanese-related sulfurtransferase
MIRINPLFSLLFLLLLGACSIPKEESEATAYTPDDMLVQLVKNERFVSTDKVADWMIKKDPSLVIVDVREAGAYEAFSLPGAINIPLDRILDPAQQKRMDCERYNIVFYANGTVKAEQAWMLNRRLNCRTQYIMKGGLNEWAQTILNPPVPQETASSEELDLYAFRKAACKYFIGSSGELEPEPFVAPVKAKPVAKKNIQPAKKAPPKKPVVVEEEEGC